MNTDTTLLERTKDKRPLLEGLSADARRTSRPSILMCAPEHYDIEYEINPWMHEENPVIPNLAAAQWSDLRGIYMQRLGWDVRLVEPVAGLPDMVFTANGGFVLGDKVMLPHFRHPDRQGETARFEAWYKSAGYREIVMPKYDNEGEGDVLLWNDVLFAGYPWRSDRASHKELAEFFGLRVVSLQLIDARFYHLDTAFTVIDSSTVALYPKAFTEESIAAVRKLVPTVIEATDDDALAYGLNAMSDGGTIVMPSGAAHLAGEYRARGLSVIETSISEYQKAGGGVKCLTLVLHE